MRTENDPKHLAYMRQYGQERRLARDAAGLCVRCGGGRDSEGSKSCSACVAKCRAYNASIRRVRVDLIEAVRSHVDADRLARQWWGPRGVAMSGRRKMVGFFLGFTPDDDHDQGAQPSYPWVKCGEGETWRDAFVAACSGYKGVGL